MIILKSQLSEILINIYCANVFDGGEIFHFYFPTLTLSWRRSLSYRNTSIDLPFRLVDWFLYDRDFRHERVKFGSFWIYLKSVFFWLVCERKKLKVFIFYSSKQTRAGVSELSEPQLFKIILGQ